MAIVVPTPLESSIKDGSSKATESLTEEAWKLPKEGNISSEVLRQTPSIRFLQLDSRNVSDLSVCAGNIIVLDQGERMILKLGGIALIVLRYKREVDIVGSIGSSS